MNKLFPSQPNLQLESASAWRGLITTALEEDTEDTLDIENIWDDNRRSLKINVSGGAIERIPEEIKLTGFIMKSNIIDVQKVPVNEIIDEYVHNHLLRKTLTAYDGDKVANSLDVGAFISSEYSFTLLKERKAEDCNIVAFVHLSETNKLVLQQLKSI